MKPDSGLDPISKLAEQDDVFFDPPSACRPIAQGCCIPVDTKVFQMFEHCNAGSASGALWAVKMEVRGELAWAQETRHVRVVHQRRQIIRRGFENGVQTGVSFSVRWGGHHLNLPTGVPPDVASRFEETASSPKSSSQFPI